MNPRGPGVEGCDERSDVAIVRSLDTAAVTDELMALLATRAVGIAGGVTKLTVTGHSLRGAIATLLGLEMALNSGFDASQPETCAAARMDLPEFAENCGQVVPMTFDAATIAHENLAQAHFQETYRKLLDEMLMVVPVADSAP